MSGGLPHSSFPGSGLPTFLSSSVTASQPSNGSIAALKTHNQPSDPLLGALTQSQSQSQSQPKSASPASAFPLSSSVGPLIPSDPLSPTRRSSSIISPNSSIFAAQPPPVVRINSQSNLFNSPSGPASSVSASSPTSVGSSASSAFSSSSVPSHSAASSSSATSHPTHHRIASTHAAKRVNDPLLGPASSVSHPLAAGLPASPPPAPAPVDELQLELTRFFAPQPIPMSKSAAAEFNSDSSGPALLDSDMALRAKYSQGSFRLVVKSIEHLLTDGSIQQSNPSRYYRLQTLYLYSLFKLRKYESINSQYQKLGNLYLSNTSIALCINSNYLIPFELYRLKCELPHYMGRTRQTIDLLVQLKQFYQEQWTEYKRYKGNQSQSQMGNSNANANANANANTNDPEEDYVGIGLAMEENRLVGGDSASFMPFNGPVTPSSEPSSSSRTAPPLTSSPAEIPLYLRQIQFSIIRFLLLLPDPDYLTAIRLLNGLITHANNLGKVDAQALNSLFRISLQFGDRLGANSLLARLEQHYFLSKDPQNPLIFLSKSLLFLANQQFDQARDLLATAFQKYPNQLEIVNNYAIACLYTNRVQEGIDAVEGYIKQEPWARLDENLLSNLKALYELNSTNPIGKRKLLDALVLMYGSDDLEVKTA